MTSEREKCGLTSLLPVSCRGRAEAFARRLHSRLRSLGSQDESSSSDESSWLGSHENHISVSQPRHSSETNKYLDFGLLESPGSPEEEIEESELQRLINKDNLKHSHSDDCHCPKAKDRKTNLLKSFKANSNDSDSDGSFYDTENDLDQRIMVLANGDTNSESSKSQDSETGIYISSQEASTSNQEESFETTSDCTPQPSSSLSEDVSTLSLRDEECASLGTCCSSVDLSNCDIEITSNYSKCNGDLDVEEYQNISLEEKDCPNLNCDLKLNCNISEVETYVSSLSIEHDLTVECPSTIEINVEAPVVCDTQCIQLQLNGDDNEEEERPPRVRRCSSLKTGKTPPGTPGRKKIVRFADVLGLDLADIRTYLDEIPKVPVSAFDDLKDVDLIDSPSENSLVNGTNFHGIKVDKILMPLFQQPGGQPNFLDLVRENQVCLENAFIDDPVMLSVKGTVRVRNLDFHKSVYVRYTLDSWKTFADVQGVYVDNSCDGFSDKFSFLIYAHTLSVGQRLEIACRFQCRGCQYWDSNRGVNYCFQCLPATSSPPITPISSVDDWGASFYY